MGCYSIIKRKNISTEFKVMVIKSIIQAVATYGDKFFGMSTTRCKSLQKIVDSATRTLAKCKKYTALCKVRFIEKRFIEECLFCRNIAPETIENMLLECSRWQALRADILAQYINIYRAQVAKKPPLLRASISMRLVETLTTKFVWLLATTGFLRASDIHRIDDAQTIVKEDKIIFKIIAPKKNRKGKPIERNCTISAHRDKILCSVLTYNIYKLNIARDLCPTLHQNFDAISVNRLLRYIKDYNKPLSVNSITRYIHKLSKLIDRPHNTPIPKAKAIGATLAAEAGIPSDQIISHAFWSSYSMFDSYYCLLRQNNDNITESILPLE
ncbi:hypothetical protein BB561_004602 [Smittium simulii]|uniref:Uncharacterized protein n=1 Tax=Smittium simulii TaxID=133385 RepID=A0A2T9YF84_9FUNG|nr:hypothetical protein BB561_004602 [Smittium simulii]